MQHLISPSGPSAQLIRICYLCHDATAVSDKEVFPTVSHLIWNDIPFSVRQSPSLDSFKRNLKTHYFANKCIGDYTKAAARQSPNCITKYCEKRFSLWRTKFLHPAMWHDHDIDFARWLHSAMRYVALGWHAIEFAQTSAILEFYIWFRFRPYHRSRHVILHQSAKFYRKRTTLGTKEWRHVDFQDGGSQPSWLLGVP